MNNNNSNNSNNNSNNSNSIYSNNNNPNNNNSNNNNPNNQISGIEPNQYYTYKQKNIPQQQEDYIVRNSSFIPSSTFGNTDYSGNKTNSSRLENMNDFNGYRIDENFVDHKPIQNIPNFEYKNNTLYPNLNKNLLYETISEVRINVDSMDRDVLLYPDPFEYMVLFAPVVNSNTQSGSSDLKADLKLASKNKNLSYKEQMDIEKNNNSKINNSNNSNNFNSFNSFVNTNIFGDIPAEFRKFVIAEQIYDKNTFNPNIISKFENIKYVKIDNIVLPKYNDIKINKKWMYCTCHDDDEHDEIVHDSELHRIQNCEFKYKRYIPNIAICSSLYSDRFIQINIKELQNVKNLSTNNINSLAFTIYPDKPLGVLYWRGNPYYAVRTYEKTLLGNINKFTISFLDSWNKRLTLDLSKVNYEINQIKATILLAEKIEIQNIFTNEKFKNFIITKLIEIIKCFVMINYNIDHIIPFYSTIKKISKLSELCYFTEDVITLNTQTYKVKNIYDELNDFVSLKGFINVQKTTTQHTTVTTNINNYIENVIFYNDHNNLNAINNVLSLYNNYILFGCKILTVLKAEIFEIPRNKYFQNFITFVFGIYTNELNTEISYEV